jgi:hypothetical protein
MAAAFAVATVVTMPSATTARAVAAIRGGSTCSFFVCTKAKVQQASTTFHQTRLKSTDLRNYERRVHGAIFAIGDLPGMRLTSVARRTRS